MKWNGYNDQVISIESPLSFKRLDICGHEVEIGRFV